MSFFNLPTELQTYIYEFDPTYHRKLNKVKDEISFLNSHRYFYYDKDRNLSCFYIVPKNIDIFLERYCSFFTDEKKDLIKGYLENHYNKKQINILGDDTDEIYFDIEKYYTFKKPITKISTSWNDLYEMVFLSNLSI